MRIRLALRPSTAVFAANTITAVLTALTALSGIGTARAAAAAPATGPAAGALKLHVASPDWRDQVLYFLMTDRFDDGDPSNNDQGAGEYDPVDNAKFNGGDLKGIERRLAYIQGLGATAIWTTPVVANQWWNTRSRYGGYHGYWAEDFMRVDAHYGSLQDYQRLSHAIHSAGMYLVQDVVVNHVGDYFSYRGDWDASDPARHFQRVPDSRGSVAPTQPPFDRNDAGDAAQRAMGIYHWTPKIQDFNDPREERDFQLADLDDLNTENPVVREALRASYGYWIDAVGIDAMRIDTAFYVPPDYFRDFLSSDDATHPGILRVAARSGRRGFHVFGEGFALDKPYADTQARKIDGYMHAADGTALLPGMINFPLYGTTLDVFARGRPTAELAYRIDNMMRVHANPHLMPTFVDNHDVDRFLSGGSEAGLKQSLLLIMTVPGIPTLYYGTEQAFSEQRAAMFKAGQGSGGRDRFDTAAPLYRFIQHVVALRRDNPVFSRGVPTMLASNAAAPGVLAYEMNYGDTAAIVVFNSSDRETLLDNLETTLAAGTRLQGMFAIAGTTANEAAPDVIVGEGGHITMPLQARSGMVWKVAAREAPPAAASASLTLDALPADAVAGNFIVTGGAQGLESFRLVVDGDLSSATTVRPGTDGSWKATVDTGSMVDASIRHGVVAWAERPGAGSIAVSERREFRVARSWGEVADVIDPAGDDHGPRGRYRYPTDPGWSAHRPLDIERVRVFAAGGAIKVELRMHELVSQWNAPNGFDHVAFTLFVEVPGGRDGTQAMPLQNATLPDGMRWHYRLRSHGWSNALFAAEGSSARNEGKSVIPASVIETDPARNTVTFTLPGSALGNLASISGVKLYVTTWDYDGGYRGLGPDAESGKFGGGDGATDALVMDDTVIITLP